MEKKEAKQSFSSYFLLNKIKWSHTPGRAPHFGGLWEAGVKSAKCLLRKILGDHTLSLEEYTTILTEVEANLNSRPLYPVETLPEDGLEVLTPGHFLIGHSLTALPPTKIKEHSISPNRRWNLCQKLSQEFWSCWKQEYLLLLQKRQKWNHLQRDFKSGDLVLLKDQELYQRSWPLAVVTAVHPGNDGHVRAVTVRTRKGSYTQPVVKLVLLLPIQETISTPDPQSSQPPPREDAQAND